jgi:hypothetical protein
MRLELEAQSNTIALQVLLGTFVNQDPVWGAIDMNLEEQIVERLEKCETSKRRPGRVGAVKAAADDP